MYTAASVYGASQQPISVGLAAPTQGIGVSLDATGLRQLTDPGNPLLWFGALLALTLGAAAVSGSARIGKAKISGSVGKA